MDFNDMNMQYRERYFEKANTTNLEKYVLSEIYNPICDYENATKIIRNAKSEIVSKNLMFLEIYICYTQLFCKSVFVEKLDHIYNELKDSEKAILFYLKSLGTTNPYEKNQLLDNSISLETFVANLLDKANMESDYEKKEDLKRKAFCNIKKIYSLKEIESTLDANYYYDVNNYIDSEIKKNRLNEIQISIYFPK